MASEHPGSNPVLDAEHEEQNEEEQRNGSRSSARGSGEEHDDRAPETDEPPAYIRRHITFQERASDAGGSQSHVEDQSDSEGKRASGGDVLEPASSIVFVCL